MANTRTTPFPLLHQPRPWSAIHAGVAPGGDARWRNLPKKTKSIDMLRASTLQLKARHKSV